VEQFVRNPGHHDRALRVRADILKANPSLYRDLIQEQVQRLRCEQLPINCGRNRIELADVIGPGEFDFEAAAPAIRNRHCEPERPSPAVVSCLAARRNRSNRKPISSSRRTNENRD
jgi:hypothetical protein